MPMSFAVICSYLDSEMFEEAVRDYEKIFKMDKTAGSSIGGICQYCIPSFQGMGNVLPMLPFCAVHKITLYSC